MSSFIQAKADAGKALGITGVVLGGAALGLAGYNSYQNSRFRQERAFQQQQNFQQQGYYPQQNFQQPYYNQRPVFYGQQYRQPVYYSPRQVVYRQPCVRQRQNYYYGGNQNVYGPNVYSPNYNNQYYDY